MLAQQGKLSELAQILISYLVFSERKFSDSPELWGN